MKKRMTNKKPLVISAWICAGKTYLTKKYTNIIELPSGDYKYILTEEQKAVANKESLKSTKREINPAWPKNYYDAILTEVKNGKYDIILIAPCMPFSEMRDYGIEFVLAYPDPTCKEEYIERARKRGANEEFVKRIETNIQSDFEDFVNQPNEKLIMQPGEYLEDALIRAGIL
ncbi:MAG: hypothetical protein HGA33_04620 [Candidatus Moranbacteria bacterium]|nr:hypothetical protein [Candidatus Moranbacteria bacterium]